MLEYSRPILLAFCGKSATGKTSTAKWLHNQLMRMSIPSKIIVSDTTRPPREKEKDGIDYNFISEQSFIKRINKHAYIEWTQFRKWYYGTHKTEIVDGNILIGVFNPQGIKTLREKYNKKFVIIPIYLVDNCFVRLDRSIEREGKWKFEFFRRIFADWFAFLGIKKIIESFHYYIILEDEADALRRSRSILFILQQFNIIRLGNIE